MTTRLRLSKGATGAALTIVGAAALLLVLGASRGGAAAHDGDRRAGIGEARRGGVTVDLAPAVTGVRLTEGRSPGRPIVVIDPGHGGRDPGAVAVSGTVSEKQLTLVLARELRARLAERGRVRVALTRDDDRYLTLDQRADLARRLDAAVFLSLHMDSAPNPLARGASVYSLSDVASDAAAARFAAKENRAGGSGSGATDGSIRAILADLALRGQMTASADLAARLVGKAAGRVGLRPEPHKFASFHVLRRAAVPAVLFEAGYISNADDELLLASPAGRARIVDALARTVEAEAALRHRR
ncbi:N-acetylmuramoyl-L-alanine amidase [Sphingomonas sp.]|uniref:N-acetylmuramoyl-L-alanine amidase family protein n=1 Tax=Sphingomonas sp. TaxID=28214 RepID=UPI00286E8F8A|nr:N-acetylmuramoyl-L-alanine amidase [Sphingomonas sp.]